MTEKEKVIVSNAREIVEKHPEISIPSVEFKRDWAFGNAGLEDETITRQQVNQTIK